MYTDPKEVLVTRADLPTVGDCGDYVLVDNIRYYKSEGPTAMRAAALRFLSAAVKLEDEAAEKAVEKAKQWELEHAVPLARTMYDTFHSYSDNFRETVTEELWLNNYNRGDRLVHKWVATAKAALQAQQTDVDADGV